ncbi:transmembrane protein PVRIG isoform X13 [Symphalangus syndactylus]
MRTEAQVPALQPPEPRLEGAMGRWTLALSWVLLTLCVTAGTPEVWVQVQMEATELSSFTVHWLSALPTPVPILWADLAGILGVSGVLLSGCGGYLLHLLHRQKHSPAPRLQPSHTSSQAPRARVWAPSQASQAALHVPYATINTSCRPATLDTAHPHRGPSWEASSGSRTCGRRASLCTSAKSSWTHRSGRLSWQSIKGTHLTITQGESSCPGTKEPSSSARGSGQQQTKATTPAR